MRVREKEVKIKKKKAQVSIEYMVVVGFTTLVLGALIVMAYYYSSETKYEVSISQIEKAARKIVDTAKTVYYAGAPAKSPVDVTFPEGIKQITINPNEIIFTVRIRNSDATLAYSSRVNLTGSISITPGLKHIIVEAKNGFVQVSG